MNQDQALGLFRNLLALGGGLAIGKGWLTSDQISLIGGAAGTIIPLVWTFIAHTDSAKIAAAAALPDVKKIVTVPSPASDAVKAAVADVSQPKVSNI
jgi:hypothetical protein